MASVSEQMAEPLSPLIEGDEDVWFFSEDEEKSVGDHGNIIASLTKSEIAQQLLEYIESFVKSENNNETFPDWFEEKIDLPIFSELQPVPSAEELKRTGLSVELQDLGSQLNIADLSPAENPKALEETEAALLLSFEETGVIDLSDDSGANFVTAPDGCGRPPPSTTAFAEGVELLPASPRSMTTEVDFFAVEASPAADLAMEMAIVDEVVRSTALDFETHFDSWETETSSSQFGSSCSVKSFDSPGSSATEESDDPEWTPPAETYTGKARKTSKRSKPYGTQEDRKLRKKEQNKNAATRYRQKKKAEVSEILEEEKALVERQGKLVQQLSDIKMEIKCLKKLMRDLFQAKGLPIN